MILETAEGLPRCLVVVAAYYDLTGDEVAERLVAEVGDGGGWGE